MLTHSSPDMRTLDQAFGVDAFRTITPDQTISGWKRFFEVLTGGEMNHTPFTVNAIGEGPATDCRWFIGGSPTSPWNAAVVIYPEMNDDALRAYIRDLATVRAQVRSRLLRMFQIDVGPVVRSIAIAGPPVPGRHRILVGGSEFGEAGKEMHFGLTDHRAPDNDIDDEFGAVEPCGGVGLLQTEPRTNKGGDKKRATAFIGPRRFTLDALRNKEITICSMTQEPLSRVQRNAVGNAYHSAYFGMFGFEGMRDRPEDLSQEAG